MNVTENFSYNMSTADEYSPAVESSIERNWIDTADNVRALLSHWREEYHRYGVCTRLCLSAEELLNEPFLQDREEAFFIFDEICDVLSGYSSVISINIYARCGRISFEFYSESEGGAESGLDPYELMELCESRGCELTVEEDMTGSMHLAVSFDHIDIGTVGFKSTPYNKRAFGSR